jgi:hypothetical protein
LVWRLATLLALTERSSGVTWCQWRRSSRSPTAARRCCPPPRPSSPSPGAACRATCCAPPASPPPRRGRPGRTRPGLARGRAGTHQACRRREVPTDGPRHPEPIKPASRRRSPHPTLAERLRRGTPRQIQCRNVSLSEAVQKRVPKEGITASQPARP